MKISLIIIGDEVLLGQVLDTNSVTIAKILYNEGLEIFKKWTVADNATEILTALNDAAVNSDLVLMTGGLGPTKDDITKKTLAKYFGIELIFSDENKNHLERMLQKRHMPVTNLQLQQCYIPANAQLLDNQLGTALGMWMEFNSVIYISMPGVPYEMEYIMKQEVIPRLKKFSPSIHVYHQTIHTVGMGETEIADIIEPKMSSLPDFITLAYLPAPAQVKLRLTGRHENMEVLKKKMEPYLQIIKDQLSGHILGYGDTSLEAEIGKILIQKNKTLSTAESCSGGYLAHRLVSIPGASKYFKGSVVAYQYETKENVLNVSSEILDNEGAVSKACVIQMALGACSTLKSDFAIATSGIAGPDGGTPEKPVGTVWVAYGSRDDIKTKKFQFFRNRTQNIEATAVYAMILFWKYLKSLDPKE